MEVMTVSLLTTWSM